MTPVEFAEWQAFDRIEPIGEHRGDWRNAMLICAIGRFLAGMWGEDADLSERTFMPFVFDAEDEEIHEDDPDLIFARLGLILARRG